MISYKTESVTNGGITACVETSPQGLRVSKDLVLKEKAMILTVRSLKQEGFQ
jgi:hypothetical protein